MVEMLLLLLRLIIQVEAVDYGAGQNRDALPTASAPMVNVPRIDIAVDGKIYWNFGQVDRDELRDQLEELVALSEQPKIMIAVDNRAPFAVIDEVLSDVKAADVTSMNFVGGEETRNLAPAMRQNLPPQ